MRTTGPTLLASGVGMWERNTNGLKEQWPRQTAEMRQGLQSHAHSAPHSVRVLGGCEPQNLPRSEPLAGSTRSTTGQ